MQQQRHPQPCGCVTITEQRPFFINDVDISSMVATIVDVERCANCQRQWDANIKAFADRIDQMAFNAAMAGIRVDG